MTRDTENWYGEEGFWVRYLNDKLRERPVGGSVSTYDDDYHELSSTARDDEPQPPWLDLSDDREDEL